MSENSVSDKQLNRPMHRPAYDGLILPCELLSGFTAWAIDRHVRLRCADVVIPSEAHPYMYRWQPMREYFAHSNDLQHINALAKLIALPFKPVNVYIHRFVRSDDDLALHDHPWPWASLVLQGSYDEHVPINRPDPAGPTFRQHRARDSYMICQDGASPHRVELSETQPLTLFITGAKYREWGFHCNTGWRHHKNFTTHGCG